MSKCMLSSDKDRVWTVKADSLSSNKNNRVALLFWLLCCLCPHSLSGKIMLERCFFLNIEFKFQKKFLVCVCSHSFLVFGPK